MGPFSFGIMMMHLLLKCHGHTYLYVEDGQAANINSSCKESIWWIDTDCEARQEKLNVPHAKGCGDSPCLKCGGETADALCLKEAQSGFYACARDCDHSVYPFRPQLNVLDTYIVALQSEQLKDEQSLSVSEGSPILFNCSFTRDIGAHQPYVVYWLKMLSVNGSASCLSSYSSEGQNHVQYCPIDPRLTSPILSEDRQSSHDLRVGSSQLSDGGVYVCVLHKRRRVNGRGRDRKNNRHSKSGKNRPDQSESDADDEDEQRWIIIRKLTVTVKRRDTPNSHEKPPRSLVGLHGVAAFFLITLLALVLLLEWRKMKSSQAHQAQVMPRSPSGGRGNIDLDCSPYAVGFRQPEPYSVVNIRKQMDSARPTPVGPSGLSSDVPEQYSVVQLGIQEGSADSTPAGQTSDASDAYSVITLNNS